MRLVRLILTLFMCALTTHASGYDRIAPSDVTAVPAEAGSIGFFRGGGPASPGGLTHLSGERFLTVDNLWENLVVIDPTRGTLATVELEGQSTAIGRSSYVSGWGESSVIGSNPFDTLNAYDFDANDLIFSIDIEELWGADAASRTRSTGNRGDYVVVERTLFFRDDRRRVRAIDANGEIIAHEEALVLMDTIAGPPEETYSQLNPFVAERNRELRATGTHYVIGGRYYATEWEELGSYLDSIWLARDWTEKEDERGYGDIRNVLPLVGYDQYHNSYWGSGNTVRVLSPTGQTLGVFSQVELVRDAEGRIRVSGVTLEPDGTVWVIGFDEDAGRHGTVYLYRFDTIARTHVAGSSSMERDISEQVGPAPATVTVPADYQTLPVPIRRDRFVGSTVVTDVASGSRVSVLDQTDPARIGPLSAPWYRIATADGTEGWIYGAFLEFSE